MTWAGLCRVAAMGVALGVCGCDADWSAPAEPLAVSNASNGQPMPAGSLPRGASSYGNPPNAMVLPRLGTH